MTTELATDAGPEVIDRAALSAFHDSARSGFRGYVSLYRRINRDGTVSNGIRITEERRNRRGERVDDYELIDLPTAAYVTAYVDQYEHTQHSRYDQTPRWNCWAGISHPDQTPEWKTIVRALHVNDRITLQWMANNNNQGITERGIVRDELRLEVHTFAGPQPMTPRATFLIDVYCGPDDTARMVRR